MVIVLEEAQNLAPSKRARPGLSIMEKYFTESRKFGAICLLISQLPSATSDIVYKDSKLVVVHRLPTLNELACSGLPT